MEGFFILQMLDGHYFKAWRIFPDEGKAWSRLLSINAFGCKI